jgi:serine/threonine protein kinase
VVVACCPPEPRVQPSHPLKIWLSGWQRDGLVLKVDVTRSEVDALQAASRVPGVMPSCAVLLDGGAIGLLMPLSTCLATLKRRLTDEQRMEIGLALLRTLAGIHNCGVLHCDIKPHNLFLQLQGSRSCPLVGDFGSARMNFVFKENDKCRFEGTSSFCVSRSVVPSATRDVQSLCLSVCWLAKPWRDRTSMPPWNAVLTDPVAAQVWSSFCSSNSADSQKDFK